MLNFLANICFLVAADFSSILSNFRPQSDFTINNIRKKYVRSKRNPQKRENTRKPVFMRLKKEKRSPFVPLN